MSGDRKNSATHIPRSKSLPLMATVRISMSKSSEEASQASSFDSNESGDTFNERYKVNGSIKKKFRAILGVLKKPKQQVRKSVSGGNIVHLTVPERRASKRQNSLPNNCIPMVIIRDYEHENIYRGLMHSLLHPLGTPEGTSGLRPGDLLDHLREVFDVDRGDHEAFIREELLNRPQNLQVNVTILEANGLRGPDFTEDTGDSYCIIQLHNPARGKNSLSPRASPRVSPKGSPRLSPKSSPNMSPLLSPTFFKSQEFQLEQFKTSVVRNSSHPKWNEEFQIEIEEFLTEEVHIYVFNQEVVPEDQALDEKKPAVKSFLQFRNKSSSIEDCTVGMLGCIGKIVIPIRNISSIGTDDWYDIVAPSTGKGRQKPIGKCHLRLGISYKLDSEESCNFSTEDYYNAFKQFLNYTYTESSRHLNDQYGQLSLKAHRILKMFAESHGISKLSQAIVNVTCLLEIHCERDGAEMSEYNINTALDDLQMTWATMQIGQKSILDRMPLTDSELSNYRRIASRFIDQKCDQLDSLPKLFPPTMETLNIVKAKLGITVQLLGLDLWEPKCDPQNQVSRKVTEKLQNEVTEWMEDESLTIPESNPQIKDKVIPEIQRLIELVNTVSSHCSILPANKQFYTSLGVNYYRCVSIASEKKICSLSTEMIEKMNKYMKRYNSFPVNIMAASKYSLSLYFALRRFSDIVRDNVTRRELFRLRLFHYQEWFEESMIYWLQTFRTECINRLEKALEIEKDVVVVTSLVKYSHSSVDVLSCFAQVIAEWGKIDFRDPDCSLMGVTKITDIICDGARMYADKIHSILERNCYFDNNLKADFDVNDRLCITINNIEHVRLYLAELREQLAWDAVITALSASHDSEEVGVQAMNTLQRLIDVSNSEILMKSMQLLRQIAEKMRINMEKYMEIFTRKEPLKPSSVDKFLGYISNNMQTLNDQLMPDIYPYMMKELWTVILQSLDRQILIGRKTEYYEQMKQHLRALQTFFQRVKLNESVQHSEFYNYFVQRLDLNSKKSEELMLMYLRELASDLHTPPECYGHLAFKAAYVEETRGNMTIYVTVLRGSDLPGLDTSGYSDPYVEVSLQPLTFFAWSRPQRTHIVKQTLNPVFNITFQFPNISKEYLNIEGSSILLTVFDHDTIGWDDFAGEVIVQISGLPKIDVNNALDKIPAIIMPLKRPKKPLDGPFVILSQRDWDKPTKSFVSERMRFIEHQPTRTDKRRASQQGFFSSIFANVFS